MAEVTISNSPVHSDAIITYPYGIVDYSYTCDFHTGLDFAPYGTTGTNPDLFPCFAGEVVEVSTTGSLGYRVVIRDSQNRYWRYCHMVAGSITVSVGQGVTTTTKIGNMGMTGNATGIHLHLECSTTQAWQCSTFLNPATVLEIPNVDNTIIHYDGSPTPPPPPPIPESNNVKKWAWHMNLKKVRIK